MLMAMMTMMMTMIMTMTLNDNDDNNNDDDDDDDDIHQVHFPMDIHISVFNLEHTKFSSHEIQCN